MSGDLNPVFIVGLMRSGTSIMYRTIQKLRNFQAHRINFVETKIFMDEISFDTDDLYYPSLIGYFYHKRGIYDEFLDSVKRYTEKLRCGKNKKSYDINIKDRDSAIKNFKDYLKNKKVEYEWKRSYKNKIIKEYFSYAKRIRQSKRIVEKTPQHYIHLHQIFWTFPHSHVIWMIRHPIDIFTSSIKRSESDKRYTHYWDTQKFINEFNGSFHLFKFYKNRFEKNITMIKYEDFVNNPLEQLKRICCFLKEPFDEEALYLKNHEIPEWKPYSPFIFSEIVNKTDRDWKNYLSKAEAAKIEASLNCLMEEYNYDSYSGKKRRTFSS